MTHPSLPPDEAERLSSLRALGLLDTPPEERFDRITRLAQAFFDVPIVLVSLVDAERQWFKSRQGLDAEETAREISFCGHAIRGSGLFVVPDATRDERFSNNPLVAGPPEIRFYAGAPLSAPDGRRVGTLCLVDRRPRDLTPEQRKALRDLADVVQDEIALGATRRSVPREDGDPAPRRRAARVKVLAAFAFAFVLLAAFTVMSSRARRRLAEDLRSGGDPLRTAADADRLDGLMLVATGARVVVLGLALVALLWDMSAREKVEDALRLSRDEALDAAEGRRVVQAEAERLGERLSAVLDHVDTGIVMVELDGTSTVYNVAAERIHGAWREQMDLLRRAGTHPPLREDGKTAFPPGEDPLGRALKGETVRSARVFLRTPFRPNGYRLTLSAVPLHDPRGLPSGAVLMFTEMVI